MGKTVVLLALLAALVGLSPASGSRPTTIAAAVSKGEFAYEVAGNTNGEWIDAMQLDGSNLRRLLPSVPFGWSALHWSPDGRLLAAARANADALAIATADGRRHHIVVQTKAEGISGDPEWSPDSGSLAFVRTGSNPETGCTSGSVWAVHVDGTKLRRISRAVPGKKDYRLELQGWSPDGRRLLYAYSIYDGECRPAYQNGALLITVGEDGSHQKVITRSADDILAADWSPDGSRIAYLDCAWENSLPCEPWVIDANGRNDHSVGHALNMIQGPYIHWSRDGHELLVPDSCTPKHCADLDQCNPATWSGGMLAIGATKGSARPIVKRAGCKSAAFVALSRDGNTIAFAWTSSDSQLLLPMLVGLNGRGLRALPPPRFEPRSANIDPSHTAAVYLP